MTVRGEFFITGTLRGGVVTLGWLRLGDRLSDAGFLGRILMFETACDGCVSLDVVFPLRLPLSEFFLALDLPKILNLLFF